ncbi:cob(I)yrinic acid a,c-diamide adenosyltransferase [Dendrosporobacter sp. 1207_IL3150]|uniref:cob(I)yrinic acid a,c-diamide adenosyltransferase n=1 Tax=Dendrosporobacter sp. 1207_IL3150 TaxID=3084054 RepID=UPI002FDA8D3E
MREGAIVSDTKGLIIVHTGNGKGKTTAALGMALRAWGQGLRVLIVQFIKGNWKYGELKAAEALGPNFVIRQMGEGFVKDAKGEAAADHQSAANEAFEMAKAEIISGNWNLIILDEINYAVKFGLVSVEDVIALLDQKPEQMHVVLTGRDARDEIIEKADLVTEMREIKHPYKKGIKAQKGIEF